MEFLAYLRNQPAPAGFGTTTIADHTDLLHAAFISWLAGCDTLAPATCKAYLMAVRSTWNRDHPGQQLGEWASTQAHDAYLGVARLHTSERSVGSDSPFTLPIVTALVAWARTPTSTCTWTPSIRLCFVSTLLSGFATGMRVSEVVDTITLANVLTIDEHTGAMQNIQAPTSVSHTGPLLAHIHHSKTDFYNHGHFRVIPNVAGALNPAEAFMQVWQARFILFPDTKSLAWQPTALFYLTGDGQPYCSARYRDHLASALLACDIPNPEYFGTHSMKVGITSILTALGYLYPLVERLLGWKPEARMSMVQHYGQPELSQVLAVQRAIFSTTQHLVFLPIVGSRHANGLLRGGASK